MSGQDSASSSGTASLQLHAIGRVRSCFSEKFAIPQQAGIATAADGYIEFSPPYHDEQWWRGIDQFSHLWLIWYFHGAAREQVNPTVRPPRLGGNERVGVFASRSPFRPNPLGLSVVKLERVERRADGVRLYVSGLDLVEGTPLFDVKPYVPYADAVVGAQGGFAHASPPQRLQVVFVGQALSQLAAQSRRHPRLQPLIEQTLALDPRPAYRREGADSREGYANRLYDLDVRWRVVDDHAEVYEIVVIPRE